MWAFQSEWKLPIRLKHTFSSPQTIYNLPLVLTIAFRCDSQGMYDKICKRCCNDVPWCEGVLHVKVRILRTRSKLFQMSRLECKKKFTKRILRWTGSLHLVVLDHGLGFSWSWSGCSWSRSGACLLAFYCIFLAFYSIMRPMATAGRCIALHSDSIAWHPAPEHFFLTFYGRSLHSIA